MLVCEVPPDSEEGSLWEGDGQATTVMRSSTGPPGGAVPVLRFPPWWGTELEKWTWNYRFKVEKLCSANLAFSFESFLSDFRWGNMRWLFLFVWWVHMWLKWSFAVINVPHINTYHLYLQQHLFYVLMKPSSPPEGFSHISFFCGVFFLIRSLWSQILQHLRILKWNWLHL